jgi:cobalt-zinc-cadmium efflux system outer membrane protein
VGWKHIRQATELGSRSDDAVKLDASIPIPLWDQNLGNIGAAEAARTKVEAEREASKATLILTLAKAYDTLNGALRDIDVLRSSALPNAQRAMDAFESGYSQGRFTLLEVLDAQSTLSEAGLRELEALASFHTSVATIEGLTGTRLGLTRESDR